MIMTKKEDRTYKQVGFIYRNDEIDVSGEVPVDFKTTNGIIGDYTIKGNAYQSDGVSPDTPQEVKAVGDRTGNLFDYKKYFESTFTKYNEYFEGAEIQLKPFTTYTFATSFGESTISTGVINTAFIITTSTEEPRTLTGGISSTRIATKTTEADGIIKIYKRIRGIYLPKKEDFDSGMHWLMINEGDTALPYEPYGYKIPVVTRGKNLLEPIGFSAQSITNINDYRIKTNSFGTSLSTIYGGSVLVTQAKQIDTTISYMNGFFYIVVDFSKFTIGKKYTLSFDYEIKEKHSELVNSIAYIGKVTNFVTIDGDWSKDGRKSVTFTVKEGFNPYIEIRLCGNSIFVSNIQIEEDLTATPYEPYHEPITTPIYLDSPLYKIGDYADSLNKTEEVRVIKELILTGNENWIEVGGNANNTTALFMCAINDIIDCGNVAAMDVLTTHYKVGAYYSAYVTSEGFQHTRKKIYIRSKQLNVADFKSYLAAQYAAGTPVTVYYVLAEPETKSITLPKIPTFDGTNTIDINTEIKPSNISLSRPMTEIKKILNKEGKILFEKGFTREVKSILSLTLNCINKPLKNYTIYGNTIQNGTPTPENPVEVQAVGDRTANLFDYSTITTGYRIVWTTGNLYKDDTGIMSDFIEVTEGQKYQISDSAKSLTAYIIGYNQNKEYLGAYDSFKGFIKSATNRYSVLTIPKESGCQYIKLMTFISYPINATSMFIEGEAVPNEFIPYGYKIPVVTSADGTEPITTPIYLPTPLYSGEVLRSDGSREVKWGKLVLTGKETSISIYSGTGSNGVAMIIANMQKGFYQYGFCSHAIVEKNHADGTIGLGVNNNTLYWFGILDILGLSASLLAPFKEWLKEQYAAGTPVTVWYQLAEPTTETFTAPQIPTINGTTVIDVDTAVKPTEMYIKYKSSK